MRQNRDTRILPLGRASAWGTILIAEECDKQFLQEDARMCDRKFRRVKSIFLAAAPMILLPMLAAAQPVTIQLTATEVVDPLNLFGSGAVGAFLDPGLVNCPGTQPTGNPAQPCPAGSRINLRGLSVTSRFVSQSPLLTGWFYSEGNADFDANASGHVWGTFRLELDSGGVWIGSWIVDRSKVDNENVWVGRGKFVGRGTGGNIDGMQVRFSEVLPGFMPFAFAYIGSIDAQILVPPPSQ